MRFARVLSLAVPGLAIAVTGITAVPAHVWRQPQNVALYQGFDPNLIYVDKGGSSVVQISTSAIDVTATSSSKPTINFVTTLLPKLSASFDIAVLDNKDATEPFRVGLWSPWTTSGQFVVFGPAPDNLVTSETIIDGIPGPTLIAGSVQATAFLGRYQLGQIYHLTVILNKSAGTVTTRVTGPGVVNATAFASSALLRDVEVSLTASVTPAGGRSNVELREFKLVLPQQSSLASRTDDPLATGFLISLAVAAAVLITTAALARLRSANLTAASHHLTSRLTLPMQRRTLLGVLGAAALYTVGNGLLFLLGGHPFDMGNEKFYAYVAHTYGPAQLYYLSNVVSLPWIWGGVPFIEAAFPYEPISAYLHTAIGSLGGLLFGSFGPRSVRIEYLTKAANATFGLIDALLIYAILRQIGSTARWSMATSGIFLFNPAVWFSMSVWGQTHVFSIFLVLSAVLFIERKQPTLAWLTLAAACLTRPQMVVFGLLLGAVLVRRFSSRQNITAISWTAVALFILLLPFTLASSPALPVEVMLHNFNMQEAGGNVGALTTVSQDSYSIWPLITYFAHGASGLQRAFTPSSELLIGSVTYQRAAQALTLGATLLVVGAQLIVSRTRKEAGGYLPFVALGVVSFLMLLTGILATYFLLALPILILCRRWMSPMAYVYVVLVWTVTTLVPMYGDMGVVISSQDYPLLSRANNWVTESVVNLYAWDRFITVGVVANICAVLWVGYHAWRPALKPERDVQFEAATSRQTSA